MNDEEVPSQDPLNLEAVDRDIRLNELKEQLTDKGMTSFHASEDCPSEEHEQFLRGMAHFESGPLSTHFQELVNDGITLPPPDSLSNAALRSRLWEVINALAERDVFLHHTDHLSDRQLYEHLFTDSLREETTIMPPGSGWTHHIDMIGGCTDEDIQIGLRYYDAEESRQHWAKDFPEDVIPPHEDPPYDHDRLLPRETPELVDPDDEDDD